MNESYAKFVEQRFKPMETDVLSRLHAAVGISGEAGELLDAVKKAWAYNKPLDVANVYEELGDILFYVQAMCNNFGWDFQSIINSNVTKLIKRYPTGYSDQAAQARADKTNQGVANGT